MQRSCRYDLRQQQRRLFGIGLGLQRGLRFGFGARFVALASGPWASARCAFRQIQVGRHQIFQRAERSVLVFGVRQQALDLKNQDAARMRRRVFRPISRTACACPCGSPSPPSSGSFASPLQAPPDMLPARLAASASSGCLATRAISKRPLRQSRIVRVLGDRISGGDSRLDSRRAGRRLRLPAIGTSVRSSAAPPAVRRQWFSPLTDRSRRGWLLRQPRRGYPQPAARARSVGANRHTQTIRLTALR